MAPGEGVLLTDSAGYRLAVPSDAVDAACFERLVKQARQKRVVDTAGAAVIYRQALALCGAARRTRVWTMSRDCKPRRHGWKNSA